jgi:hypothetical protein
MILGDRVIAVALWLLNTYHYVLYWLNIYALYIWISLGDMYWYDQPLPMWDIDNQIINDLYHRDMLNFQTLYDLHNLFSTAKYIKIHYMDEKPGLTRAIIPKDTTNHLFGEIIAKVEIRRMLNLLEDSETGYEPEYEFVELSEILDRIMRNKSYKKTL